MSYKDTHRKVSAEVYLKNYQKLRQIELNSDHEYEYENTKAASIAWVYVIIREEQIESCKNLTTNV